MDIYCEFTKQQLEAAMNFVKYLNDERQRGHVIDISRMTRVVVRRDPKNVGRATFEIEMDDLRAA